MEKGLSEEKLLGKVRAIEVLVSEGRSVKDSCREAGISDSTYYKWRGRFSGIDRSGLKRIKELEKENEQLKRAVLDLQLEKQVLKEAKDFFLRRQGVKSEALLLNYSWVSLLFWRSSPLGTETQ